MLNKMPSCRVKFRVKVLLLVLVPGTIAKQKTRKQTTNDTHTHKHKHTMNKIKTADKASILNTKAKATKIGLKETESNRVSIAIYRYCN